MGLILNGLPKMMFGQPLAHSSQIYKIQTRTACVLYHLGGGKVCLRLNA